MRFETTKGPDGRITGPLRPCTAVNFNPVELVVEGQLRITVPKPGTTDHHVMKIPYKGRLMQGHYCYIASPMADARRPDKEPTYYTTVTGHETDELLPIDVPTVDARVFTPHSIACELWSQYNSPNNKLMGGILMFDQDPHTLSPENLEKTHGRIWVPTRTQLQDSWQYSYTLRETTLEDELDRIFEAQRNYCDVIMQQAHTWHMDEDVNSRKMITDTHRDWARFALKLGYLQSLPEWVSAKLALTSEVAHLVKCEYCGIQQPSSDVYFCRGCHAPYDAFKAFMAGKAVAESYLDLLPDEQYAEVQKVKNERLQRSGKVPPVQAEAAPDKPLTAAERKAAEKAAKAEK
jgi:hypothetical protein